MTSITATSPIEALQLSMRVTNVLRAEDILTVADLVRRFPGFVRKLPGIGKRSLVEIKTALDGLQPSTASETQHLAAPTVPSAPIVLSVDLRDYFIAHAPAEPQPWFFPVMPQPESPLPSFSQMYRDHTPEELRALSNFDDEWMPVEDVSEERVRNYLFQRKEQQKRSRQREAEADRERYIQWPAAWADAMLAAREGSAA